MSNNAQSPIQEAVSIITIVAILVAVGCYVAAVNNIPMLTNLLFWVASCVYQWFPCLNVVHVAQFPMVVAAVAVGGVFYMFALPFAGLISQWFSASQLASLERQTAKLKRNRARIIARRRDKDRFDVS